VERYLCIPVVTDIAFDKGALTKFDISSNRIRAEGGKALAAGIKGNQVITKLNISSNEIGYNFEDDFTETSIIAIADAISDMGAISSVNLLTNKIGIHSAKILASMLKEHPTLKSLCGNSGDGTELDMRGKEISAEGAIMLAPEIAGNRALLSLNVASNNLGKLVLAYGWTQTNGFYRFIHADGKRQNTHPGGKPEGIITLANAIKGNQVMTELNIGSNSLGMLGAIALAGAIPGMGALTTLDISMNKLTRGALKAGQSGEYNRHYETDMTGMTASLGVVICTQHRMYMQALSPLPMPSRIWGR
jgi:Ran GTPase-activating protein (RanGAP) involved in mRNA processing and transport